MGRPVLSRLEMILLCLDSNIAVGDSLLLAVIAQVVGVVVSAFRFTPFFLTTGCAVGIMDVAGGTAWTLEVMVETGVAAITGV